MNRTRQGVFGFSGFFFAASVAGCVTSSGEPPIEANENAMTAVQPAAQQATDVAQLAVISDAVLGLVDSLPGPEQPDQPSCEVVTLGCVSFDPCPAGARGTLTFAEEGCPIRGTALVLEGSISLVEFHKAPAVVDVAFAGLTLADDPATGRFRIEAGAGASSWSFEIVNDSTGDSISGSGSLVRVPGRTTVDVTMTTTEGTTTRGLVVTGLTIADGARMPDGGTVAVTLDPAIGIPEGVIPADVNGDGVVNAVDDMWRALLLSTQVEELGLSFLPTSPSDGRVQVYLNDPANELLNACVDTDDGTLTWGTCA
jgi:hypothetical protein